MDRSTRATKASIKDGVRDTIISSLAGATTVCRVSLLAAADREDLADVDGAAYTIIKAKLPRPAAPKTLVPR
jgi:hypothetical protein